MVTIEVSGRTPARGEYGTWVFADHNDRRIVCSSKYETASAEIIREFKRIHKTDYLTIFLLNDEKLTDKQRQAIRDNIAAIRRKLNLK